MNIYIVLPRATMFDKEDNLYVHVADMLIAFSARGYKIIPVSHLEHKHKGLEEKINLATGLTLPFYSRKKLRAVFGENESKPYLKTTIVIGSSDEDLHLAANFKLLLINPGWSHLQGDKASKYGLTIDEPLKVIQMLDIIKNQQQWFFRLNVDEKTELYALTSANNNSATDEEGVIIDGFRELLKRGNRNYYEALFFHFISGVMQSDELREIELWGIMPSSDVTLNSEMLEIKERARYLTGKKQTQPVFIRHTPVNKSRYTDAGERLRLGASKHLSSIKINPFYRSKLRGKTVCILDDYVTNGSSFEALRNLLLKAGVSKIIFVAMGRFKKGSYGIYQKEDYKITGDVFTDDYMHELVSKDSTYGSRANYNEEAKEEVGNIYRILNDYQ